MKTSEILKEKNVPLIMVSNVKLQTNNHIWVHIDHYLF